MEVAISIETKKDQLSSIYGFIEAFYKTCPKATKVRFDFVEDPYEYNELEFMIFYEDNKNDA